MGEKKPFAFVLMPFDASFGDVYHLGIQAACKEVGIFCERVDEQIFQETILERIVSQIRSADLLIAEMTGRNPNVFFEVGFAQALKKRIILVTRDSDDIPFDLRPFPHVIYDGSISRLKAELVRRIPEFLDGYAVGHEVATEPIRPWVIINKYTPTYLTDEETGEEYLSESIHIVNRGHAPAVNIIIPEIRFSGCATRLVGPLPASLGPGESIDAKIRNLRETLDRARGKLPGLREARGLIRRLPLHIPLVIEYSGLDQSRWTTEHVISLNPPFEISFEIAHQDNLRQLTDLSILEQESAPG